MKDSECCGDRSTNVAHRCSKHAEEELKLHCNTCRKLICLRCTLKGSVHNTHDYYELDFAFEKYKEEVASSLSVMEKQLTTVNKALVHLDARQDEIATQRAAVQTNVHHSFQSLHEILNKRNEELVCQLEQITREKLEALAVQRKEIETAQTRLTGCISSMNEVLSSDNSRVEMLMERTVDPEWMTKLSTILAPESLKPNAVADMTFDVSSDTTSVCQEHGLVLASTLPYPPKCHATGKGLDIAVVGEKSTATLQSINFLSKPCELPAKSLECELVSEITGAKIQSQEFDVRSRQSQHLISYQPRMKGNHQLHIKVDGQEIKGSPFTVAIKSPVENLGSRILTIEKLETPRGGTINERSGEVIVTEYNGHCVSVFSRGGKRLNSFGSHGSSQGQLKYPRGVALDADGNILVADSGNQRIQKFTVEGEFLSVVGGEGSGSLQFKWPDGVAFNTVNGKIYISDDSQHIHILNSDLTFFKSFGKEGSGKGQFCYPRGIACDSTGQVYVADSNNHRIQVFTAEGKFVRAFGRHGHGMKMGELMWPVGIALNNASGLVYISENSHCVSVFTLEGHFVTSFGQKGEGSGEFNHPYEVAVDTNGVVYVCDADNNRVQVF